MDPVLSLPLLFQSFEQIRTFPFRLLTWEELISTVVFYPYLGALMLERKRPNWEEIRKAHHASFLVTRRMFLK
jgi:hypothetical protein